MLDLGLRLCVPPTKQTSNLLTNTNLRACGVEDRSCSMLSLPRKESHGQIFSVIPRNNVLCHKSAVMLKRIILSIKDALMDQNRVYDVCIVCVFKIIRHGALWASDAMTK